MFSKKFKIFLRFFKTIIIAEWLAWIKLATDISLLIYNVFKVNKNSYTSKKKLKTKQNTAHNKKYSNVKC